MSLQIGELCINEEYLRLVPRPTKHERQMLKESIILHGQREPIITNSKHEVLDGHTRFEICGELNIEPKYVVKHFESKAQEMFYVIDANLARRQLTPYQKFELVYSEYLIEKRRDMNKWKNGSRVNRNLDTAGIFSRQIGMSRDYFFRCQYLKQHASDAVLKKLSEGTTSVQTEYVKLHKKPNTGKRMNDKSLLCCPLCRGEFERKLLRVVKR